MARMKDGVLPKLEFQKERRGKARYGGQPRQQRQFDAGFASFGGVPVAMPDKQLSEASQLSDDDPVEEGAPPGICCNVCPIRSSPEENKVP
jgi:hypothetical protein